MGNFVLELDLYHFLPLEPFSAIRLNLAVQGKQNFHSYVHPDLTCTVGRQGWRSGFAGAPGPPRRAKGQSHVFYRLSPRIARTARLPARTVYYLRPPLGAWRGVCCDLEDALAKGACRQRVAVSWARDLEKPRGDSFRFPWLSGRQIADMPFVCGNISCHVQRRQDGVAQSSARFDGFRIGIPREGYPDQQNLGRFFPAFQRFEEIRDPVPVVRIDLCTALVFNAAVDRAERVLSQSRIDVLRAFGLADLVIGPRRASADERRTAPAHVDSARCRRHQ